MGYTRADWSQHYTDGQGFRPLGDEEKSFLVKHVPVPENGRALDAGCGNGELAAFLAGQGYAVDAADFADGALARARDQRGGAAKVRWLCLDIERDDPAELHDTYDLITLRLTVAFLHDRSRVMRSLGARLRPGGALVVITPVVRNTPEKRRHIALDEDEISLLTEGFEQVERFDAAGLAMLVLRGPGGSFTAMEKGRPNPQAMLGACVVVTDDCGRVLLGRSTHGMWELPGGRIETGESAQATAVRELKEETGLIADAADAHLLTILHDDRADVRRISAVVRLTAWRGTLSLPEPHRFQRWEWHDLHTLPTLGAIFAPSAQALDAVWPGVLPDLPSVHSYPLAVSPPTVAGDSAEAVRLRGKMADTVVAGGWAPSARVQEALRTVPRHRFAPEVPLHTAYDDNLAVVTCREQDGTAVSSVSAAWLQADMLEQLGLEPGMTVFEAGSGGYNAELIARVVAPHGRVITVDVDPQIVRRTERLCAEAGSGRVTAVLADGSLGAPRHVPAGGFDGMMITHNAWDVAPAWREQLSEGRYLVLPLEMHGYTRSIAFQRQGDVLHARGWTYCGFVRDRGAAAHTASAVSLADGALTLRWEDGTPPDTSGLEEALRTPRHEVPTGVVMPGGYSYETLQLYAATTLPGFCRLAPDADSLLVAAPSSGENPATIVADGSLAYLTTVKIVEAATPAERRWEFYVHAFGPAGPILAEHLSACVREWNHHVRSSGYPPLTVHPASTPDQDLPAGDVLDKKASRLVFQWPGRKPHRAAVPSGALAATGRASE
ncbi:methyltransferase, FxLD system (plasmid) [Streptomyces sp. NBC_01724]|uniref:methyltransferase, FxLD system n=1 Tax=Streptomyces sp. NBC_01724 TaxID=2975922 RepID=UPI002E2F6553|nr:methyltransferase, FxLD system [Streptomyces sp. NBC_01724]